MNIHVPDSLERSLQLYPSSLKWGIRANRWNPTRADDDRSGYSCKAGGYGCMHIQPMKVPTMTGKCGAFMRAH